jgi:hypothetical protein
MLPALRVGLQTEAYMKWTPRDLELWKNCQEDKKTLRTKAGLQPIFFPQL